MKNINETHSRGNDISSHNISGNNSSGDCASDIFWYDWPALFLLVVLAVIVFAQFFTRYVLNNSWAWTEEVSRYLLIGVVFAGCVSVVCRREHIRLEVVESWVNSKNIKSMRLFSESVSLIYYAFLAVSVLLLAGESSQNLVSMALPKAAIYGFVFIALVMCGWVSAKRVQALILNINQNSELSDD